jgi:hypothetical protein
MPVVTNLRDMTQRRFAKDIPVSYSLAFSSEKQLVAYKRSLFVKRWWVHCADAKIAFILGCSFKIMKLLGYSRPARHYSI